MIDKLNFNKIGTDMNIKSPQSSLGDSFLDLGKYLTMKDESEQERIRQAGRDLYQRDRDAIADSRYEADKKERLEDKNRLLQKDYNTTNAMSAIENKDAYIAGRMSAEQKAIQDTLANADPVLRSQIQSELKGYDPKASGQQWADTALGQSNVDANMISNLKRDIVKQAADEKYKAENLALQKEQNAISAGARADQRRLDERKLTLEENKLKAPSKDDVKAAQTREGLDREFKLNELKIPDSSLTNDQLENILKEEKQKISDIKKEKKELEKSGSFPFEEGKSISDQRKEFLSKNLLGTEGITTNDMNNYLKEDMNNIDRFLLDAEIKLGKKYNEKDILNRIASERKNQKIASPWDTRIQDALETVSEQIGLGETDY